MARPEVLAFLADIKADLDDDTPRLILADFLTDHDDPRGELIRLQCRREALPPYDRRRETHRQRETELLRQHQQQWVGELADCLLSWQFQRGLLRCQVSLPALATGQERLLRGSEPALWIEHLQLVPPWPSEDREPLRPSTSWFLQPIPSLDLSEHSLGGQTIRVLSEPPEPFLASRLNLSGCHLDHDAFLALAGSPAFPGLRDLDLGWNGLTDESMSVLANAWSFGRLTRLHLHNNHLGARAVRTLASCPHLEQLRDLDLSNNGISDDGVRGLLAAPWLERLTHLNLSRTGITRKGLRLLTSCNRPLSLQYLNVSSNSLRQVEGLIESRFKGVAIF